VRYVKLGEGGGWEGESISNGVLRFGFASGHPETLAYCEAGDWEGLAASWRAEGKAPSTATRFTNETRKFWEAGPDDLWITFVGERLYWGFLEPGRPEPVGTDFSSVRRVANGWRCVDRDDQELIKSRLPGNITKLAAYRGTSCSVDAEAQVVRRINAQIDPDVAAARGALSAVEEALVPVLRRLGPRDMEVLVELIFGASGWRRVDTVGKARKLIDLDLELPSTEERAFVQVKARSSQKELDRYIDLLGQESFSRMFYVFHTGNLSTDSPQVSLIGPQRLARMTIEAGLADWCFARWSRNHSKMDCSLMGQLPPIAWVTRPLDRT
jgi:hypothetical protein